MDLVQVDVVLVDLMDLVLENPILWTQFNRPGMVDWVYQERV